MYYEMATEQCKSSNKPILVPSATRLSMSCRVALYTPKLKLEVFHLMAKNECAAEIKIVKHYAFILILASMTVLAEARVSTKKKEIVEVFV